MLQNRYILDHIGSKTAIRILRCLYRDLHIGQGISEMAKRMNTSRANVYRKLPDLEDIGIVRHIKKGRKKLYKVDTSSPMAEPLFEMFNHERYMEVHPETRNFLELLQVRVSSIEDIATMIMFGSHARGLATKRSDIDLCIVHRDNQIDPEVKKAVKDTFPDVKIEAHYYSQDEFEDISDFAVLDSVLIGISIAGHEYFFKRKSELRSISKDYLIYRLENCKKNMQRAKEVRDEAREYFEELVEVSLGEMEAVLNEKRTLPRKDIPKKRKYEERIHSLHEIIGRMGKEIWLE